MSTRATILVKYTNKKQAVQYYHHCDGYPEFMGELLKSYVNIAGLTDYGLEQNAIFKKLLNMEKHFEKETKGTIHGDIEFVWYVDLDAGKVSYTKISYYGIELNGWDYIKKLVNAKEGESLFYTFKF